MQIRRFKRRLFAVLQAVRKADTWRSMHKCDVLFVPHENHYTFKFEGRYYSPIFGSLRRYIGNKEKRLGVLLRPVSNLRSNNCTDFFYTCNRSYLLAWCKSKLVRLIHRENPLEMLWVAILRKTQASTVITVLPDPYMCRAARQLNIELIEFQHGVINSQHPSYGEKYVDKLAADQLPTRYWVWDESSAKTLKSWAVKKNITVEIVGNLWLSRFLNVAPDDFIVQKALQELPEIDFRKKTILISLQPKLELYYDDSQHDGVILRTLKNAILGASNDYNWLIRLHPGQLHGYSKRQACRSMKCFDGLPFVEWRKASTASLPALLKIADVHLTSNSSVIIEAAKFGLRSVYLDKEINRGKKRDEYFVEERNAGFAIHVENRVESVLAWLKENV